METFSFGGFMREGGWGMWPVLLLGIVGVASATRYVVRPERYCLRFVGVLWLTLLMVVAHATVTDLAAVFHGLGDTDRFPAEQLPRVLLIGLKESSRPAALGGIFLSLLPLLAAAGIYRESVSAARDA